MHQGNIAIKSRFKSIRLGHNKELKKFLKKSPKIEQISRVGGINSKIVPNFPSYALFEEELNAFSYGLDSLFQRKLMKMLSQRI